jgi:hypothetical protein
MNFSSALDGVTVANTDFTDVSMIEEIFAVEKRKAVLSGPDSDGSDGRIAKKVAQDIQQTQAASSGGPSTNRESASVGGPSTSSLERPRAVAYSKTSGQPVEKSGGQTKVVRKQPDLMV